MKDNSDKELAQAICLLSCTLRDLGEQRENKAILHRLADLERIITMNSQQLEVALNNQTTQIGKIAQEQSDRFDVLTKAVADLTAQVNNGETTPAVDAALVATQAALDSLDAAIPDAPNPPVA